MRVHVLQLVTREARAEWEAIAGYGQSVATLYNNRRVQGHDTVGAVALDAHGNFAAATSTGGITFKRVGRVGDSPLLGSGCYADNTLGAISTTGHGESILRYTLASRVLLHMALQSETATSSGGGAAAEVVAAQLEQMYARTDGGSGGAICIGPSGELGIAFTSSRMAWAFRNDGAGPTPQGIEREANAAPGIAEIVPLVHH